MIAIVAFLMASSTTEDMFGGVSMNTHSIPSRLAAATIPLTELTAVLLGGSMVPRPVVESVRGPLAAVPLIQKGLAFFLGIAPGGAATGAFFVAPLHAPQTKRVI